MWGVIPRRWSVSNGGDGEGPIDLDEGELSSARGGAQSDIFGQFNVLGTGLHIVLDGKQVTHPGSDE
jgi:hypothetical protein